MKIEFTGRQTEVAPKHRALADRKLKKLARVLPGITHVHVILEANKHRQIAEVTVHSRNLNLAATEATSDLGASLGTVIDKLTRQAQRHIGRRREIKRRDPARHTAFWSGVLEPAPAGDGGPRIIDTRRISVKPMSIDEAVAFVRTSEEGLLVFRDKRGERLKVVYRRQDGNLGLIEPEA
jgi:putative sigma-54 modulation protein